MHQPPAAITTATHHHLPYITGQVYKKAFENSDWKRLMRKDQVVRLLTKKLAPSEASGAEATLAGGRNSKRGEREPSVSATGSMQRLKDVIQKHYRTICGLVLSKRVIVVSLTL